MEAEVAVMEDKPAVEQQFVVPAEITALVQKLVRSDGSFDDEALDALDTEIAKMPAQEMPLNHIFTPVPGYPELVLYCRSICMFAGVFLTSRIHLFEHPFVVSSGAFSCWDYKQRAWQMFTASHIGVTPPGTRRIIYVHQDTIMSTFHVTGKTDDPDEVVRRVTSCLGKFAELGAAASHHAQQEAQAI